MKVRYGGGLYVVAVSSRLWKLRHHGLLHAREFGVTGVFLFKIVEWNGRTKTVVPSTSILSFSLCPNARSKEAATLFQQPTS